MSTALVPVVEFYRQILQPVGFLQWFGISLSQLDVAAAARLCVALRQIREKLYAQHAVKAQSGIRVAQVEPRSFVREASTALLVVYGGEAVTAPFLGVPPSFMASGVVPALYTAFQAIVEKLPAVPEPSLTTELPLALFDGISRAYLLCNLIPPVILTHTSSAISQSPWSLLVTSLLTANAGFFFVNFFSFLQPHPLSVTTPPELQPYGWSTMDIWVAPFITGLYALLTHAQPFWADAHSAVAGWLGAGQLGADGLVKVAPVDPEVARAACATLLAIMFSTRALKTFGVQSTQGERTLGKRKLQ